VLVLRLQDNPPATAARRSLSRYACALDQPAEKQELNPLKTIKKLAFTFAAFICLTITGPVGAQSSSTLVVPGKSLGRVHLGFTTAQARKVLGKPHQTLRLKNGTISELYKARKTRRAKNGSAVRDRVEILYKAGKVIQIGATSPAFRTATGLSTGSTLRHLNTTLKPVRFLTYAYALESESGYVKHYVDHVQKGIAFESNDRQESWFWRDDSETLIVHRKGVPVVADRGGKLITSKSRIEGEN
jgi:hypothetical protein